MISVHRYDKYYALDFLNSNSDNVNLLIIIDNESFKGNIAKYHNDMHRIIYSVYLRYNIAKTKIIHSHPLITSDVEYQSIYTYIQKIKYCDNGTVDYSCELVSKLIDVMDYNVNNIILLFTFNNDSIMDLLQNQLDGSQKMDYIMYDMSDKTKNVARDKSKQYKMIIEGGTYLDNNVVDINSVKDYILIESYHDTPICIKIYDEGNTVLEYTIPNNVNNIQDKIQIGKYLMRIYERISNDSIIYKNITLNEDCQLVNGIQLQLFRNSNTIIKKYSDMAKYIAGNVSINNNNIGDYNILRCIDRYITSHEIDMTNKNLDTEDNLFRIINKSMENNYTPHKIKKKIYGKIYNNIYGKLISPKNMYDIMENVENGIKVINTNDDSKLDKSKEFFHSLISVSDWYEELNNGSGFGLLIKINIDHIGKVYVCDNGLIVNEITTSFISVKDYIDGVNYKCNDDKINLNTTEIFSGDGLGTSNGLLPLYINKYHWEQIKQQIPYIYGIIYTHNPYGYSESHDNYIFHIFMDMCHRTCNTANGINEKLINIYMAVYRTCSQVAYEKKYTRGIKTYINNIINTNINKIELDKTYVILGQIITTGTKLNSSDIDTLINKIYYSHIKKKIKNKFSPIEDYNKFILSLVDNIDVLNEEINKLIEYVNIETIYITGILVSFKIMYNAMRQLINKYEGYRKMIFSMDDNYGLLPDDNLKHLIDIVTNSKKCDITYMNIIDSENKYSNEYRKQKIFYIVMNILNSNMYDDYSGETYIETISKISMLPLQKKVKNSRVPKNN